jgi:hypothetical protein
VSTFLKVDTLSLRCLVRIGAQKFALTIIQIEVLSEGLVKVLELD